MSKLGQILGPPIERVPRWWLHCPIFDAELVGPYPAGVIVAKSRGRVDSIQPEMSWSPSARSTAICRSTIRRRNRR
jgi:hypothetical protein